MVPLLAAVPILAVVPLFVVAGTQKPPVASLLVLEVLAETQTLVPMLSAADKLADVVDVVAAAGEEEAEGPSQRPSSTLHVRKVEASQASKQTCIQGSLSDNTLPTELKKHLHDDPCMQT